MKISAIVPVYNTERYLERCLDSLINQTYADIEIIIINDGSTDGSAIICDRYKQEDKRIVVIHKQNGGLSDARNKGLGVATGKYVLFVDSDDYLELDACQYFVDAMQDSEPDILCGDAVRIEGKRKTIISHSTVAKELVSGKEFLLNELSNYTMNMAVCFKMFRKDFIVEHSLSFLPGILHEDELFTPIAFLHANRVIRVEKIFYYYIIRRDSITTQPDRGKNAKDIIYICSELDVIYSKIKEFELKRWLYNHIVDLYLNTYQKAELYKRENISLIRRNIVRGHGVTLVNKLRVPLFCLSPRLYSIIHTISCICRK